MSTYEPRTYRISCRAGGLQSFTVTVKETDLWLLAESDLSGPATDAVIALRRGLEAYAASRPGFYEAMEPLDDDPLAPPLVRRMLRAGMAAGTGPMAAVAGAIAQATAEALRPLSARVAVENGGDVFADTGGELVVGLMAGASPFSGRLGLRLAAEDQPLGLGTSSGTVGHSVSLGRADAATIVAADAALADAVATAMGNRVRARGDLDKAVRWASRVPGVLGALAVMGESIAAWGQIELVELGKS